MVSDYVFFIKNHDENALWGNGDRFQKPKANLTNH